MECICKYHSKDFRLLSYNRFIELIKFAAMPLYVFMQGLCRQFYENTGVYYVDSTKIEVCHIKREHSNKVFKGIAKKGKTSVGWFFGLKLHLVINNKGEIMNFQITPGNTNDLSPVSYLMKNLQGWLFGDKGYIGEKIFQQLKEQSVDIFTKLKKNMKEKVMTPLQKSYLKKRGLVETVIDQLKNICQIEHTRHRSPINALANIFAGLIAYTFKPRKPSIKTPAKHMLASQP